MLQPPDPHAPQECGGGARRGPGPPSTRDPESPAPNTHGPRLLALLGPPWPESSAPTLLPASASQGGAPAGSLALQRVLPGAQSARSCAPRTLSPPLPWSWGPCTPLSLNHAPPLGPVSCAPQASGTPHPEGGPPGQPQPPVLHPLHPAPCLLPPAPCPLPPPPRPLPPGVQVGHGATSPVLTAQRPGSWPRTSPVLGGELGAERAHLGRRVASSLPQAGAAAGEGGA